MTAMRLKRYPSPSGGIAFGKIGVGAAMLKQGKTAKDYAQNGLVAIWDGIENAGWGVHDSNATTWKDLSGNGYDITVASGVFDSNSYDLSVKSTFDFSSVLPTATVEFVGNITSWSNDSGGVFLSLPSTDIAFGRYGNKGIFSKSTATTSYTRTQFMLPDTYPRSMSVQFFSGGKRAFFDGVEATATTENWTTLPNETRIGCVLDTGRINGIRIYSKLLSDSEIAANYAIDKERFNLP